MSPASPDSAPAAGVVEARRFAMLRLQLLELHPFWGHLLLTMKLVAAPGLGAIAATDCRRTIWYDPELTRHLPLRQLGFVLAHELGHVLYESMDRRKGRERHLWNCATDYAINRIVASIPGAGYERTTLYDPPPGILLDRRFGDKIAEVIYEELAAERRSQAPRSIDVELVGEDGGTVRLPGVLDHGGGIDVHLPADLTDEQRDELNERIGQAVDRWAQSERAGHAPGELIEALSANNKAVVPWAQHLREWVDVTVGRDEYCLARPNRRYLAHDLIVPGAYGERLGHVVVAVDTSASMTASQLSAIAAELKPLLALADHMTLILADARVQKVIRDDQIDAFLQRPRVPGRGGTDHRPVFAWLEEHGVVPDVFIGLTDLYSSFPPRAPHWPVLWVTPPRHGPAPFGQVIPVPEMK